MLPMSAGNTLLCKVASFDSNWIALESLLKVQHSQSAAESMPQVQPQLSNPPVAVELKPSVFNPYEELPQEQEKAIEQSEKKVFMLFLVFSLATFSLPHMEARRPDAVQSHRTCGNK